MVTTLNGIASSNLARSEIHMERNSHQSLSPIIVSRLDFRKLSFGYARPSVGVARKKRPEGGTRIHSGRMPG
jgi:hypothetical protein